MAEIVVDESRHRLVLVTYPGTYSDDEFMQYLGRLERILARRVRIVTVFDATRMERPTAARRKQQAEWLSRWEPSLMQFTLLAVFVVPTPLVRGALTAVFWWSPPKFPHVLVATLDEAMRLAEKALAGESA